MITVESSESAVQVTIPKGEFTPQQLNAFLDVLQFESLAERSQLTEAEADRMAEEMKAEWWARNKHRFIPPGTA